MIEKIKSGRRKKEFVFLQQDHLFPEYERIRIEVDGLKEERSLLLQEIEYKVYKQCTNNNFRI